MKTFAITEQQLQEIAGRLNALNVQGLQNAAILAGVVAVLEQIAKQEAAPADNVVPMEAAE